MANPIKVKDIYVHGDELKKLEADLIAAQMAYTELLKVTSKDANKLKKSLSGLSTATSEQRNEIEKQATQADKLTKAYLKYDKALGATTDELERVKAATREANLIAKNQSKLAANVEGSYNALSAQYSLNKIALNKLSAEERKHNKEAQKLEKTTKGIYEEMKRLQEETGKTALNVGNYKEAITGAISETLGFDKVLNVLTKNPIVGVVTLLVGGITLLFKAFQKSERGAQLMARAGGILSGVMSLIVGVVDKLATGIISAFNDPKQAMEDFVQFLKDQIIVRFTGLIGVIQGLGKALTALWKRDLKGLKEAGVETMSALVQSTTGLDKEMREKLVKTVLDAAEAFGELGVAQRALVITQGKLSVALAKSNVELEKQRAIADDDIRGFKEREEASAKATAAIEKSARIEISIAKNRLNILDTQIALERKNGADLNQLTADRLEALAAVIDAEGALTVAIIENEAKRGLIRRDQFEQDLDFLIDIADNQKTINERLIADERLTLAERGKIFADTRKLFDESYIEQVRRIEEWAGKTINANDLVNTSSAVLTNNKVKALNLDEKAGVRLLEIIRDRKTGNQDLADSQRILTEAFQVTALSDVRFVSTLSAGNDGIREQVKLFSQSSKLGVAAAKENADALAKLFAKILKDFKPKKEEETTDIFDFLGIDLGKDADKKKAGLKSAFDFAKGQLDSFLAKRIEIADKAVEASDRETETAQNNLNTQLALAAAGETANIEQAKRELETAKANQAQALRDQEKAQKAQAAIDNIEQTSNLITMVSKVYKLGFPIGLIAAGTMLGAFVGAKLKIRALTKKQFGDGGTIDVGGGSHASGNDTYIGTHGGRETYAEQGEKIGIFSKQATAKHGRVIDDFINMVNSGNVPMPSLASAYSVTTSNSNNVSTAGIEKRLDRAYNKESIVATSDGRVIIKKGNHLKIINGL